VPAHLTAQSLQRFRPIESKYVPFSSTAEMGNQEIGEEAEWRSRAGAGVRAGAYCAVQWRTRRHGARDGKQQGGMYRSERIYGSFMRTIPIPEDAQVDAAKATFENGILTVSVPVPQSTSRRREIPIESQGEASQAQSTQDRQPSALSEQAKAA
jgi:hypothetical protein